MSVENRLVSTELPKTRPFRTSLLVWWLRTHLLGQGPIPGLGRFHMPWSSYVPEPRATATEHIACNSWGLCTWRLCSTGEATAERNTHAATEPQSSQSQLIVRYFTNQKYCPSCTTVTNFATSESLCTTGHDTFFSLSNCSLLYLNYKLPLKGILNHDPEWKHHFLSSWKMKINIQGKHIQIMLLDIS